MNNKRNLKRTYILSTIGTIALIANPFQCFANNEIIRVVSTYDPFRTIEVVPYDDWSYVKKKYKLNTTNFLFLCNC